MARYPSVVLDNGKIRVLVYLPDARRGYYRGTRFDWSGIIGLVEYRGHRFYSPLHARHDPQRHDSISGPAEEFALYAPPGYDEAAAGDPFVKIGVGLLRKIDDADYRFERSYPVVRLGEWQTKSSATQIEFQQSLQGGKGWAYRYRKTVRLVTGQPELIISHRLENRGSRRIDVDQYNHNFTLIDDLPYGPDYEVEFPFSTPRMRSLDGIGIFDGNRIEITRPLGNGSLWAEVFVGEDPGHYNAATVRNLKSGASVSFRGDAPITRMVFWAVERAACPEPFIQLRLEPGQGADWSAHYRYNLG